MARLKKTRAVKKASREKAAPFDIARWVDKSGREYWSAANLMKVLGYRDTKEFYKAVSKALLACKNSRVDDSLHFFCRRDSNPPPGKGPLKIPHKLSRFACLLIVQNADPRLPQVALAQKYFAAQIRRQELAEGRYKQLQSLELTKRRILRNELKYHNKHLASIARVAGVESASDFASFQDEGYRGLYGGLHARDVHKLKGLKKDQHILDYMSSAELSANLFRATQTEEQLVKRRVHDRETALKIHRWVGQKIRGAIKGLGGTYPENLPRPSRPSLTRGKS